MLTLSMVALVVGCKKPDIVEQAEGKGSTIIRIPPTSGFKLVSLDLATTPQTFGVLDVYRDAISESSLNTATRVVITEDPSLITAAYVALPASSFTIDPGNPKVGNDYTLTFNPGEFFKQLKLTLPNASLLDPNKKYALGFKISSVDNNGKASSSQQKVLVQVGLKNRWDGVYSVETGSVQRYTAPGAPEAAGGLNGSLAGNPDITLTTVGANTLGISGHQWAQKGGAIGAIDNLQLTVDPATNQVTVFALGNATLANWEGKENKYDPATRTFTLNFRWNPTTNRREYSVVIKYKGPR